MLRMECLIAVGESGQGNCWVLKRRFDGAAAIKGVVVCDSARLVFSDNEGKNAAFSTVPFSLEGGGDLGNRLNKLVNIFASWNVSWRKWSRNKNFIK